VRGRAPGPRTVGRVYRFLLTPRWWGINLFVVLAIPFCLFMGSWQLGRFEDRVDDHRTATERSDSASRSEARPLAELLPVTKETSGARASATGRYVEQFLVPERKLDGTTGHYVLGLLRTGDGPALPVVRGWLPGDPDPAKAPAPPDGEVTVTGALQASESPGSDGARTAGGLPPGQVGMISAATLVNLVPYEVQNAWVTLDPADSRMTAVPAAAPQNTGLDLKAFQNLGYTGEWFVFAGFVVFMWFRLLRRETEAARDVALGLTAPDPVPSAAGTAPGTGADRTADADRDAVQEAGKAPV
jgi:cytochrome oxidase assembly protein ShyY1